MREINRKLTFTEYWKSKDRLKSAADEVPRVLSEYKFSTYCKTPMYETVDMDDKMYLSFKPNDTMKVQWEYHDLQSPTPKFITIVSEGEITHYYPCWNNKKMLQWININTTKINT